MSDLPDLNDPIAVLLAALRAFRASSIGCATYGGLALAVFGAPRETKDADLAVAGADSKAALLALRTAGFDALQAFERVKYGGNLITRFTLLPQAEQTGLNTVDLVEPRSARYASLVLSRSLEGELRGERIRVVAPEDFVLMKVLSNRERDVEDATSVVSTLRGKLDLPVIEAEASLLARELPDHDVMGRLGRALAARAGD